MTAETKPAETPRTLDDVRAHVEGLLGETPALRGHTAAIPLLMQSALKFSKGTVSPAAIRPMLLVAVHGRDAVSKMLEFFETELVALRPHVEELQGGESCERIADAIDYCASARRDIKRASR